MSGSDSSVSSDELSVSPVENDDSVVSSSSSSDESVKKIVSTEILVPATKSSLFKRSKMEKDRDQLRTEIDLKTYKSHLSYLDQELNLKRKREIMRLKDDIQFYENHKRQRTLTLEADMLSMKMNLKHKQLQWKNWVEKEPEYLRIPLHKDAYGNNELVLSDRIIKLSGPITYRTSEYITNRIHYYNNQNDKHPIFIIIDYSPGGSVMAGYRILKTIESSPAPVYVVVKSFAASMAAAIATLAPHSYIYPNGILLHHQISSFSCGNLTQQQEQLKDLEEWWRRLAEPIAKKLNLTIDQWKDLMYKNNKGSGDWSLFGDEAVQAGWVNGIVHRVKETGRSIHPGLQQHHDSAHHCNYEDTGGVHISSNLPRLFPKDAYWLFNPNNYWSIP